MVKVVASGKTFECDRGAMRQVLCATLINCRGIGTCGTCAVVVAGEVSKANWRDKTRRSLPPHSPTRNLRLACHQVLGDICVTKFDGFWGQGQRDSAVQRRSFLRLRERTVWR